MQIKEKYIVPAYEAERVIGMSCDICGKKTEYRDKWINCGYNIDETEISVTIQHKQGVIYPEGEHTTTYEVDICPTCFQEKLIVWLKTQGVKIRQQECDW